MRREEGSLRIVMSKSDETFGDYVRSFPKFVGMKLIFPKSLLDYSGDFVAQSN